MSIYARPAATFEATVNGGATGLVGTITVGLYDGQGGVTTAPVTGGIVESPAGSGVYTATLTAPSTAGQFSVVWYDGTAYASEDLTVSGTVVGGAPGVPADSDLFTVADLRARYPEITSPKYSDADVQDAIDTATANFERAADVAFVPRTETLTLTSSDTGRLMLPRARVISVDTITGSSSGAVTLDGQIVAGSIFLNANAWSTSETLTVTLTHGYATTPKPVIRAVQLLARTWLIRGPVDDRATQIPSAEGGVINLATPGLFGSTFGIPHVDAVLAQYKHEALVP